MPSSQPSFAATPVPSPTDTAHPAADDELLGRSINDTYLIEGVIGEGGMGRVYRARHTRIPQKRYALKVLHPEFARDPEQLARFQREAEAAACVSHPNVVGVYDVGRTPDGYSYIACELLSGTDLDGYLERHGRMEVPAAVRVAIQICDALDAAHVQNVVHRDLKPQNVFLLADPSGKVPSDPTVKVVDFGLSRFLDHTDAQITKTGVVMGTPAFMAPEQAKGQRGDHRVDIYGIGAILYASLVGRPPFEEDTLHATLLAVIVNEAPRPRSLNPDIPETLELVIQRAMSKNPEDRYSSAAELRNALEVFLIAADERAEGRAGPVSARKNNNRSSRILLGEETFDLATSRPRLLFFSAVAVGMAITFAGSAISGLELFTGPLTFTRTELALLLLGITGTLLMPAAIGILQFKKKVWTNSAKVLDLLQLVRAPLFAALIAYAVACIFIRFADDFAGRFAMADLLARDPGIGFAGFTWLLPLIALLTAGLSLLRKRWNDGDIPAVRRHLLGAPLLALNLVLGLTIVIAGFHWRRDVLASRASEARAVSLPEPSAPPVQEQPAVAPAVEAPKPSLASDDELAHALPLGVDGLLPLAEKHPRDPHVLEPLVLAFASRSTGYADAMAMTDKLLAVAPEKADSEALAVLVRRAAQTPGAASDLAFSLMTDELGSRGADLLYELSQSDPRGKEAAQRAHDLALEKLRDPALKERFSPALRIALELEGAGSCAERLPLLPRAKALGDERTIAILSPLAAGSKRGCGKWKNQPCPAACKEEAPAYLEAIKAIAVRRAGTRL
ncbi:MAG TPA: serine/threonine-protein kinase [Polyangiaceae bacterium]|nr:serine/threonine-protein kinase [Polyangiaceae bacterium]